MEALVSPVYLHQPDEYSLTAEMIRKADKSSDEAEAGAVLLRVSHCLSGREVRA